MDLRPSFVLIFAVSLCAPQFYGAEQSRTLTVSEARQLATMALTPSARKLPRLSVDVYKGFGTPGFSWFEATAASPNASPVLGHFAVNETNGDVWDPVLCKKLSSPDLVKLQKALRRKTHLSKEELERAGKAAPCEP